MMKPSSEQIARDLAQFARRGGRIERLAAGAHTEPVFKADKALRQHNAARARGRAAQRAARLPLPSAQARPSSMSSRAGASASVAFLGDEEE